MPARPISSGMVTYRSTSSALHPSGCVMTSTSGGTGLGYASMSSRLYAASPAMTRQVAVARMMNGILSAKSTSLWIMGARAR